MTQEIMSYHRTSALKKPRQNCGTLFGKLGPGEEVIITKDDQPVAELRSLATGKPKFGSCKGISTIVVEDEEHLEDFKAYIP